MRTGFVGRASNNDSRENWVKNTSFHKKSLSMWNYFALFASSTTWTERLYQRNVGTKNWIEKSGPEKCKVSSLDSPRWGKAKNIYLNKFYQDNLSFKTVLANSLAVYHGVLKSTKKCCIRWGGGGECQSNFSGSDLSATKICIQTQALLTRSERDFTCGFFMNSCSSTVL